MTRGDMAVYVVTHLGWMGGVWFWIGTYVAETLHK